MTGSIKYVFPFILSDGTIMQRDVIITDSTYRALKDTGFIEQEFRAALEDVRREIIKDFLKHHEKETLEGDKLIITPLTDYTIRIIHPNQIASMRDSV